MALGTSSLTGITMLQDQTTLQSDPIFINDQNHYNSIGNSIQDNFQPNTFSALTTLVSI